MNRLLAAALAAGTLIAPAVASAGIYTDDLTRCVVSGASSTDKATLVRWMFSAISANPAVSSMVSLSQSQREANTKAAADLMQRLLLKDCRPQAVTAIKNEGATAIEASFEVLGQVAARDMLSEPHAMAEIQRLGSYTDKVQWAKLAKEAGVPAPPSDAK